MAGNSRLPSLLEVEALKDEQLRAAREDRDPKWDNLSEVMADNIPEEKLIWGSPGQQLETKEGRYTTKLHSAKTDELLGIETIEGSPNAPQSTYDEAQEAAKELQEEQHKNDLAREEAGLYNPHQAVPKVELITAEDRAPKKKTESEKKTEPAKKSTSSSK